MESVKAIIKKRKSTPRAKSKVKKTTKRKPRKGEGRQWFDGKSEAKVVSLLKAVWSIGGSDAEAASDALISPAALSRYLEKNPDLKELRNSLRERPILKARRAIVINLTRRNPELALRYLERKRKNEFGTKQTIEHEREIEITEKEKKEVDDAFRENA